MGVRNEYYIGEIIRVERAPEPYYLEKTSLERVTQPADKSEKRLIRVTFHLIVVIPGIDEVGFELSCLLSRGLPSLTVRGQGCAYSAERISLRYFSPGEVARWLLGRQRQYPSQQELDAMAHTLARARERQGSRSSSSTSSTTTSGAARE